jgi:hypothetical protein
MIFGAVCACAPVGPAQQYNIQINYFSDDFNCLAHFGHHMADAIYYNNQTNYHNHQFQVMQNQI